MKGMNLFRVCTYGCINADQEVNAGG